MEKEGFLREAIVGDSDVIDEAFPEVPGGIGRLGADAHGGDASEVGVNGTIHGAFLHGLIVIGQVFGFEGNLRAFLGGLDGDGDVIGASGFEVERTEDGVAVFDARAVAIEKQHEGLRFVATLFSGDSETPSGAPLFPARDDGADLVVGVDAVEQHVGFDGEPVAETEFCAWVGNESFEAGVASEHEGFAFAKGHAFGVDGDAFVERQWGNGRFAAGEERGGAEEFRLRGRAVKRAEVGALNDIRRVGRFASERCSELDCAFEQPVAVEEGERLGRGGGGVPFGGAEDAVRRVESLEQRVARVAERADKQGTRGGVPRNGWFAEGAMKLEFTGEEKSGVADFVGREAAGVHAPEQTVFRIDAKGVGGV